VRARDLRALSAERRAGASAGARLGAEELDEAAVGRAALEDEEGVALAEHAWRTGADRRRSAAPRVVKAENLVAQRAGTGRDRWRSRSRAPLLVNWENAQTAAEWLKCSKLCEQNRARKKVALGAMVGRADGYGGRRSIPDAPSLAARAWPFMRSTSVSPARALSASSSDCTLIRPYLRPATLPTRSLS
jgi:hypothetical protein